MMSSAPLPPGVDKETARKRMEAAVLLFRLSGGFQECRIPVNGKYAVVCMIRISEADGEPQLQ